MRVLPVTLGVGIALNVMAQPGAVPLHRFETDAETTWQSDIFLAESGLRYEQDWQRWRWDAAFSHNRYAMEYEPFTTYDLFGFNETLYEDRFAGQGTVRVLPVERLTLIANSGVYDGFQDYRRVWLANYYRQRYAQPRFPLRPGYEDPDPKGWNVSAGARWEYWPELGFAEARAGYSVDDVAPGFIDDPLTGHAIRGRSRLYTTSATFSFENVLGSRLRSLNEFRVSDTTERDVRWSWQGALNCALGEHFIFRPLGGYTSEEPEFEAFWFGGALEFGVTKWCALIASAEYYEDTGEVLDPLLLTSAAPALRTHQLTMGVRFTWSRVVLKVSGGALNTDYADVAPASRPFTNLYRDRHWAVAQASLAVQF